MSWHLERTSEHYSTNKSSNSTTWINAKTLRVQFPGTGNILSVYSSVEFLLVVISSHRWVAISITWAVWRPREPIILIGIRVTVFSKLFHLYSVPFKYLELYFYFGLPRSALAPSAASLFRIHRILKLISNRNRVDRNSQNALGGILYSNRQADGATVRGALAGLKMSQKTEAPLLSVAKTRCVRLGHHFSSIAAGFCRRRIVVIWIMNLYCGSAR